MLIMPLMVSASLGGMVPKNVVESKTALKVGAAEKNNAGTVGKTGTGRQTAGGG